MLIETYDLYTVSANATYESPLTPADLLVALHNIDPNKCDMKTIIKGILNNIYAQTYL